MFRRWIAAGAAVLLAFSPLLAFACTGIRLTAQDGSVVAARTLEFSIDLDSNVLVVPRGYARTGTTPDGEEGLKWTSKYASVGANGVGLPVSSTASTRRASTPGCSTSRPRPDTCLTPPPTRARPSRPGSLAPGFWKTSPASRRSRPISAMSPSPPSCFRVGASRPEVHFKVQDASGGSIVIEYTGGKLNVYENPLGVFTNSPAFDWHMTNLRNYLNFSLSNAPPVKLGPVTLEPLGQGSGMLGMPGDFTPPSRFVRAVAFTQSVFASKTGDDAVLEAFHILNNFDIPKGAAREREKDAHGNILADYTNWTAASDLKTKRYYFRTYDNSQIRSVDLAKANPDAKDIATISMKGEEVIKPLSP